MKRLTVRTLAFGSLFARFVPIVLMTALFILVPFQAAFAQVTAPPLGTTQSVAVLGASTVTNTGPTIITGDLDLSPGTAITGFPPGTVAGTINGPDAVSLQAQSDNTTAYNDLAGDPCTANISTDLGTLPPLVPGVYCFTSSAQLTGTLTLNGGGNTNAVWVFKIGSTLTTASNSSVMIENGGQQCNVFWQVGSSATLGTGTTFIGNIFALASITLNTGTTLSGRALAQTGAVTLDANTVSVTACAVPPVGPIPPTIGKAFGPVIVNAGSPSILTITLSNADPTNVASSASFTDTLLGGLLISGAYSSNCGGTLTAVVGTAAVTLTGGSINVNGSCTITVPVTAPLAGTYINSLAAGTLTTSNGPNAAPAVATLTVNTPGIVPPTVSKAFSPASITAGDDATLTITLTNLNASSVTLSTPLVDTLPTGLTVASGTPTSTCVTLIVSTSTSTVTLEGSIPANSSCTVTVNVTSTVAGTYTNVLGAAIATLAVIPGTPPPVPVPPTIGKAFSPASITAGGDSTLTITVSNPNTSSVTLSPSLVDTLPSGMVIASTPALTNSCTGTLTATTSTSTVTLGGSIPAGESCSVTVPVTVAVAGTYINRLGTAAATLIVIPTVPPVVVPPTVGKAFVPSTITAGGVSALTITVSNPNNKTATLSAPLVDTLPIGMTVATGGQATSCGFKLTATTGGTSVTMSGGSIPANSSCTFTANVTVAIAGTYINTMGTAIATLNVLPVVVISPAYPHPVADQAGEPDNLHECRSGDCVHLRPGEHRQRATQRSIHGN